MGGFKLSLLLLMSLSLTREGGLAYHTPIIRSALKSKPLHFGRHSRIWGRLEEYGDVDKDEEALFAASSMQGIDLSKLVENYAGSPMFQR